MDFLIRTSLAAKRVLHITGHTLYRTAWRSKSTGRGLRIRSCGRKHSWCLVWILSKGACAKFAV